MTILELAKKITSIERNSCLCGRGETCDVDCFISVQKTKEKERQELEDISGICYEDLKRITEPLREMQRLEVEEKTRYYTKQLLQAQKRLFDKSILSAMGY